MEIKIKKAKLSKSGKVEATYIDADGNEIQLKGNAKCHNDLRVAFASLVPFFVDVTEQKEADHIDWDDLEGGANAALLSKINVTGLSIGGDDGNRFITMTGKRILSSSRVLNINAPGIEMDNEAFEWPYICEFDIAVQGVIYEVREYIVNRKWEVAQTELDFSGNPDDPFAETTPTDDINPLAVEVTADNVA